MSHKRKSYLKKLSIAGLLSFLLFPATAWADIPATPVMTLYRFNGALEIPYYTVEGFEQYGATTAAGTLAQGTSVIPCLVIRDGRPLTDEDGTPYVGFEVVVDARRAAYPSTAKFKRIVAERASMRVPNHHCDAKIEHVLNVRHLFALEKAPFFDPPRSGGSSSTRITKRSSLDDIVRAFHHSPQCEGANRELIGRRSALFRAWTRFVDENQDRVPREKLERARHLDFTMRTTIYEGHLDRGCNAYGACERNIIALSIRNRGREGCTGYQGCAFSGDYAGVATRVSQYNIWDEYLTQISGLASCFLRSDLSGNEYYDTIQAMYEQSVDDVERILYGGDRGLAKIFPGSSPESLKAIRHYYHPPAMGKCFPQHDRIEYMSGAVAQKGDDFALIANTRIKVGREVEGGYLFREFQVRYDDDRDVMNIVDGYPGFVVDGRKVSLKSSSRCSPYGVSQGCRFKSVGRYRKTPTWLRAGRPVKIQCKVRARDESCSGREHHQSITIGGPCDTKMVPVAGIR